MTLESNIPAETGRATPVTAPVRLTNIAELRLLFAACVVLSHAVQLSRATQFDLIRFVMNSEVAVQGFFILSGYLVFGSFDRLKDMATFYRRRFLRIYPAYLVAVLLFMVLGLAQAVALGRAVAWQEVPFYLAANLATLNFLQPGIGGVFAGSPVEALNGALWSIKVELMFYLLVPLLYWAAKRSSFGLVAMLLVAAGVLWWPMATTLAEQLGIRLSESFKHQLPGQLHFFALGIALFARAKGAMSIAGLGAVVAFALALLLLVGEPRDAMHAAGLVAVIGIVTALPQLPDLVKGNDISYGIYLSHFPIIQLLLGFGAEQWPFALYIATVVGLATAYGLLSWKWIERPTLTGGRKAAR